MILSDTTLLKFHHLVSPWYHTIIRTAESAVSATQYEPCVMAVYAPPLGDLVWLCCKRAAVLQEPLCCKPRCVDATVDAHYGRESASSEACSCHLFTPNATHIPQTLVTYFE